MPETSEDATEPTNSESRIIESCPACGTRLDVSLIQPFSEINCPSCGHATRVRKEFNNFTITGFLGEGGMGSVYKATDNTLKRSIALKILKKEISANPQEQEKLAVEAQMTASINHPHVVKVFDFGQAQGQFYLAMELVERGTLDHLMNVQRRVAEAQMLEVGIQIARGLQAALDVGLIHRDIKPGNILFSDSHTAKLVDFGLAIVMDEGAQSKGEIWGTPYYIAPEKLDNQPEDFRSDIYSLGGTIFHSLAGRPPYEAETASMVALKQLKSQAVSLQAFAPDISSETTYVVNRMMAKNPDERYQSYDELIGHLNYARDKLLERTRNPQQPKVRVVLETAETRKWSAYLSLGILAVVLVIALLVYLNRGAIFPTSEPVVTMMKPEDATAAIKIGVTTLASGNVESARTQFLKLGEAAGTPQPEKNWALMNAALASLLMGDKEGALNTLRVVYDGGLFTDDPRQSRLANLFVETSRVIRDEDPIPAAIRKVYSGRDESFSLLIFAVWDWEAMGALRDGGGLFKAFLARLPKDDWLSLYRPLAEKYLADWKALEPVENAIPETGQPSDPAAAKALISALREKFPAGSAVSRRLDALEKRLPNR